MNYGILSALFVLLIIPIVIAHEDSNFIKGSADDLSAFEKIYIEFGSKLYSSFPNRLTAFFVNPFFITQKEAKLDYWISLNGPEGAMKWLLMLSGNGEAIDCHQEAHRIGRASYKLYGSDVFALGDASCHSGFYHGAMEQLLVKEGTTDLAKKTEEICSSFSSDFGVYECYHGVGHGILAYNGYDLPKAIETCKGLANEYASSSCYGGVFMENIITAQGYGAVFVSETDWVSKDPHFPCNRFDSTEVQHRCYQMQTSWMLELFEYDFEKVATECENAPGEHVATCFISLGRDVAGISLRDPEEIKEFCDAVPVLFQPECIQGAVNVVIDFWGESLENQASELCSVLDKENKQSCYEIIQFRLPEIFSGKEKALAVCEGFEEEYYYLCGELRDFYKGKTR